MLMLFLLLAIDIALFFQLKSTHEEWTVYGTMGCGWTRKQIEYMKNTGKSFTFVDCEKENCLDVKVFPVLVNSRGEKLVGYNEV